MKKIILSLVCIISLSFALTFEDGFNAFKTKDYKTALKVFEELGSKGDAKSQYNVGIIYSNGYGIKKDENKALEWFEKAANQGLKEAQHELAINFDNGRILNKNLQKAADLYDSACASGFEVSCRQYDKLAKKGFESSYNKELENAINYYKNKDFKSASEIFTNLANKNYSKAYFYLGEMYQKGEGFEQNYSKAIEFYGKSSNINKEQANRNLLSIYKNLETSNQLDSLSNENKIILYKAFAENNDSEMQFKLGTIYSDGKMIEKNYEIAKEWYSKACNNKDSNKNEKEVACYRSSIIKKTGELFDNDIFLTLDAGKSALSNKDYEIAEKIFTKLSEYSTSAKFELAKMYLKWYKPDSEKNAFKWFEKVVNSKDDSFDGIAFAEYKLGEFYYSGEVVEKNYDKAIELFKQSANRKSFGERAAFKLGNFYEYGEIPLNKDLKEALHWYEIAAKTNKEAQLIVANMYYQGIGTEKNYEKAKIFYENISPKNDINLLKNLANIYELEGNVESAIEYYTRASFQGDKESGVKADKLTKKANDMKKTLDRVNQKIN